jgi:glucose/mannose-6-phosphate isomerase
MKTMYDMIKSFPDQLEDALSIAMKSSINRHPHPLAKIFISGMGGSGIGAEFVSKFVSTQCKLPIYVGKTYDTPAFIDDHTLVIISSYSGNTEETISSLQQVLKSGAKIVCISSGGEIIKIAKQENLDYILLPDNWSSPRACLGYSIISQLCVLYTLQIISDSFITDIKESIKLLQTDSEQIREKAKHLAGVLKHKILVIYASDIIEPAAIRLRQQINENSKMLCWHHVIPEMNHNELVGWRWNQEAIAVLFLRNANDHTRIQARIELTKEIVSHYSSAVVELYSKGNTLIQRSFYLIHILDYVSLFLADYNQVDPIEVRVIDFLKNELSKI